MIRTIYIAAKPGDERLYPAMNGFSPEAADELVRKGFQIFAFDLAFPKDFGDGAVEASGDFPIREVDARRIC